MVPAGKPKILHRLFRSAGKGRPDRPALSGSSSPSDLQEREGPQGPGPAFACKLRKPRGFRHFPARDGPQSTCPPDACTAYSRRRIPPRPRPRQHPTSARRSFRQTARQGLHRGQLIIFARSTICISVDHPSDCTPRKPPRNAARALPCEGRRIFVRRKRNAPDTAHSPGSAARSKTKCPRIEPDGPQELHTRPSGLRIEPAWHGEQRHQRAAFDRDLP